MTIIPAHIYTLQVVEAGSEERLSCSPGYTACLDNLYCLQNRHFCNGVGQCKYFSWYNGVRTINLQLVVIHTFIDYTASDENSKFNFRLIGLIPIYSLKICKTE